MTWTLVIQVTTASDAMAAEKRLAYLVSDVDIPFWSILAEGIRHRSEDLGYTITVHSAGNQAREELRLTVEAIRAGVEGIILSPTNSSAAVTVLDLAGEAGVPVVIADIGAGADSYVSYIESDNDQGAYDLGHMLADAMAERGWSSGTVGIVAIPQKRANGKARTEGFLRALGERGVRAAGIYQQSDFSYRETYDYARALIDQHPELRAIWLQGSSRYRGALDAIADAGRKGEILLISFDAEPEFIEMIASGQLVGAGMQQPFLMGEKAVETMDLHLRGAEVGKVQRLSVLAVSRDNLDHLMPVIQRNVLGQESAR
ncbi:substrate-binding domain-containing protein [Marinobacter sp.]|uniref:substrate-binding domain-containing protein n=1 Tax=Marinobacter sp. TaxID=50741 RepID=UPI003567260F